MSWVPGYPVPFPNPSDDVNQDGYGGGSQAEAALIVLSSGTALNLDTESYDVFDIIVDANCTITFSGTLDVRTVVLRISGDGVASRTLTLPGPQTMTVEKNFDNYTIVAETLDSGSTWSYHGAGQPTLRHGTFSEPILRQEYYDGAGTETISASVDAVGSFGYAYSYSEVESAVISASGRASHSEGYAYGGGAAAAITSSGWASFAHGYAVSGTILASGVGAFSRGYVSGYGTGHAVGITSSARGSSAFGYAYGWEGTGEVTASADGSSAFGYAYGHTGSTASIVADGAGAFASGYVDSKSTAVSRITATGKGSFAQGYSARAIAGTVELKATAKGSFAQGYTTAGASIIASADNAAQFGPGTNSLADSLKVGTAGLRFKGTVNAPGTPVNGDFWIDGSGNVVIRSGGVSVVIA